MSKKKSVVQSPNSAPEGRQPVNPTGYDFADKSAFPNGVFFGGKLESHIRQEVIIQIAAGKVHLRGPNQEVIPV